MKKTRRPIGAPSRVSEIDLSSATLTAGPERRPFALTWTDAWLDLGAAAVMRRPPWSSCAWCGDPHDGQPRCDRCGHAHGYPGPSPTRWWEVDHIDVMMWNDYRRAEIEEAFGAEAQA